MRASGVFRTDYGRRRKTGRTFGKHRIHLYGQERVCQPSMFDTKLSDTGTDIIRNLGDNMSWNDSMNWRYATKSEDEFNDNDDSAYRKEYSTPKLIGDDTYRVKCFSEVRRSICDFYITSNAPTTAKMMKPSIKAIPTSSYTTSIRTITAWPAILDN